MAPLQKYFNSSRNKILKILGFPRCHTFPVEMLPESSKQLDLKIGQRVFVCGSNSGSYAEYVSSDASMTFPLPKEMTFSQGAAIGVPYFTAYRALVFVGKLKEKENLLIHGVSE